MKTVYEWNKNALYILFLGQNKFYISVGQSHLESYLLAMAVQLLLFDVIGTYSSELSRSTSINFLSLGVQYLGFGANRIILQHISSWEGTANFRNLYIIFDIIFWVFNCLLRKHEPINSWSWFSILNFQTSTGWRICM